MEHSRFEMRKGVIGVIWVIEGDVGDRGDVGDSRKRDFASLNGGDRR